MRASAIGVVIGSLVVACGGGPSAPPASPAAASPEPSPPPTAASASASSDATPAPAPAGPKYAGPVSNASELLSRDRAPFDACYAKARAASGKLGKTTILITFHVGDQQKPESVEIEYKHRWDDAAKDCLRAAAMNVEFPVELKGKQVGSIEFSPP